MNLYDKFAWSHGSTAIDSMSLFHLQRWYTILFSTTFVDIVSTKFCRVARLSTGIIFLKNPGQTGPKPQKGVIWGGKQTS